MSDLRKTPLHHIHRELGAKLVPFAGWEMPVQYSGVMDEHKAVRETAGIFDVSHMGQIDIEGPHALELVQLVTTNDASRLKKGQAQYSLICYPNGGIVDDTIVYKMDDDHYMLCVNASNVEKDFEWIREHDNPKLRTAVKNRSSNFALLAIQGPKAIAILKKLTDFDLESILYFNFEKITLGGAEVIASRTGYTGEDGFELYVSPEKAADLWQQIMKAGEPFGIKPIGLAARDTLRLEMKYALYGNDIDSETTPLEANLGWVVKLHKNDFIGRDAILKNREEGIRKKLVCLEVEGRGIPRHGYPIALNGREVGIVTSGTMSPSLSRGIAIGYVEAGFDKDGQEVDIIIRNKGVKAKVVRAPFYKKQK